VTVFRYYLHMNLFTETSYLHDELRQVCLPVSFVTHFYISEIIGPNTDFPLAGKFTDKLLLLVHA